MVLIGVEDIYPEIRVVASEGSIDFSRDQNKFGLEF